MALTLDPTLQSRLDGLERQPEIEVLSSEFVAAIPFQGNSFGIAGSSEFRPQLVQHSSGRLGQLYINSADELNWMYTDVARNQWSTVSLAALSPGLDIYSATATELANGNIGIVAIIEGWVLSYAVISPTGTVITVLTQIEDLSNSYEWRAPYVTRLASGDYYLVYVREDPDTAWAIYGRTASVWGSWGASSDITPSGLNTAAEINNLSLFESAPDNDLFLFCDQVTAMQNSVPITNIFSSMSVDDGASWGAATARTNYTTFGTNGFDPIAVQKSNGTMWLIYYENVRVLHMDASATGWIDVNCDSGFGMSPKDIYIDSVNGKLIVTSGHTGMGDKFVCQVTIIDIASWSIDKVYHPGSSPGFNQVFSDNYVTQFSHIHAEGKYHAMAVNAGGGHSVISVIDHTVDTVTTYMIDDLSITNISDGLPAYSLPRNVAHNSNAKFGFLGIHINCIRVDEDTDRIYICWDGGYYRQYIMMSYIDLTAAPDGNGFYNMNWLTLETSGITIPNQNRGWYEFDIQFEIDKSRRYFVCYARGIHGILGWSGGVAVLSEAANCAIVKSYTHLDNNSMCPFGPTNGVLHNGSLYASFLYEPGFPFTDQRGMVRVNYLTDAITYYRPSFVTTDQYTFYDMVLDSANEIIYCGTQWGVAAFNTIDGTWTLFDSASMPGWQNPAIGGEAVHFLDYDPLTGNIIGGSPAGYRNSILMFNENGAFNKLKLITADKAGSWVWGSPADLSYYSQEGYPTAVIAPDNTLWVTWNRFDWQNAQNVLYWDNDLGAIDVTDDIVGSVNINWQLKRINKLDFTLANGHLYDPQNLLSTKNVVGQKGRKVHVRIGENIGGYTYWVNQGTFIVDTVNLSYKRADAPVLRVNATGKTSLWRSQQTAVSPLYSGSMPDAVLRDLIDDRTQWLNTEYFIPVFDYEHSIQYQWIGKTLWDMVEELCDHFFYAMYEDTDGIFTCRPVSLIKAVDHEYADSMLLLDFGPDDDYSDYTNRVRVIGESSDYTEVLHSEELIKSMSGTVGWWVKKITETVYFSGDSSRQCRNARINVTHSPKEYGLLLDQMATGDGGIFVSYIDPYEKFIVVTIQTRDLTWALVGAVGAMVVMGAMAIGCGASIYSTCGGPIYGLALASSFVLMILAAMAQYQYEVWARPLGRVKSTIQYEANDLAFQFKLNGEIITEEITDPLCESITECRRVAEGNVALVTAQRRRVKFGKLTHLQDELLDKLKVYHPYSGEGMELLVVGLKRTYTKGGGVFDAIEGWRYIP